MKLRTLLVATVMAAVLGITSSASAATLLYTKYDAAGDVQVNPGVAVSIAAKNDIDLTWVRVYQYDANNKILRWHVRDLVPPAGHYYFVYSMDFSGGRGVSITHNPDGSYRVYNDGTGARIYRTVYFNYTYDTISIVVPNTLVGSYYQKQAELLGSDGFDVARDY